MILLLSLLLSINVFAAKNESKKSVAPTSKSAKGNMSFDSQLVEGQIYRPDLSVVTGDTALSGQGLIRLRPNFQDHMQFEASVDPSNKTSADAK